MGERGPKPSFIDKACPNEKCRDFGITDLGNIVGNGTYRTKSGRVRKYICRTCDTSFCDRTRTAFFNLRTKDEKVLIALKLVLKGMGLRGIAEVLGVKLDTVRFWIARAAEHADEVNDVLMKDLKVSRVEMDELWTFVKKKRYPEWKLKKIARDAGSG
ncbi:MAG: hypothetical protein QGG50_08405 [Methanopyri archaeon]|jgi:transposase-like protein|nr:hypothetical protein [Methanopyri archaeon]|tara:strand:- start:716 stop:1189 length:474 start_codon:yes stop_codon:yes gene_type:complete